MNRTKMQLCTRYLFTISPTVNFTHFVFVTSYMFEEMNNSRRTTFQMEGNNLFFSLAGVY